MSNPDVGFPLALTDFEHYTFLDDSPEYPMVIALRIHLEGQVNQSALRDAFAAALEYHPLLRCRVERTGRQFRWVPAADRLPRITFTQYEESDPPTDCPGVHLNLLHETGAWFEVRSSPARSVLIAALHHACVDGIGALKFLADVFALYGRRTASDASDRPEFIAPDPAVLTQRGWCPRLGTVDGKAKKRTEWLRGPASFLLGRNYCIRGDAHARDADATNVLHTAVLDRPTARQLRKLAAGLHVSTNDLCMMVYLRQIAEWTEDRPGSRNSDLFRVLMPVSMRTPDHDRISAANVLSYVFQPFRRTDCLDEAALLANIHRRTVNMIHSHEGAVLLRLLGLVRRTPGLFRLSRWLQPSFATAILANVGELRRVFGTRFPIRQGRVVAGNLIVRQIDGVAPVRNNTNIAISFGGYGGELTLNLRANPLALSGDEAAGFLQDVVLRLRRLAEQQRLQTGSGETPAAEGGGNLVRGRTAAAA